MSGIADYSDVRTCVCLLCQETFPVCQAAEEVRCPRCGNTSWEDFLFDGEDEEQEERGDQHA